MIVITSRAPDIADWVSETCTPPSSVTVGQPWQREDGANQRTEMILALTPVDQLLFDLYFAGWFIKCHSRERWYDDTELNRLMLEMRRSNH